MNRPSTGRETLADEPDLWSFRPRPGLRDSQNEPVVTPAPVFIPKKPDGFLSDLWKNALQDPAFDSEPFFALSRVLHHETHSLYTLITERSTWTPADRTCLRSLVSHAQHPGEADSVSSRYFTCPPESIAPEIVERCDAWALVNGLMNMEGNKNPVVTSLRINARLGRCIFGSMELGLAKMRVPSRSSGSEIKNASDSEVRSREVDAWLALRQQGNYVLARFRQVYAEGDPDRFLQAVLELQQDTEALWELNRRKGKSFTAFKEEMKKLYRETDAGVIQRLAAFHQRPVGDFRFYPGHEGCSEKGFDPGRGITYQVLARPGDRVPRRKSGSHSLVELVEVAEGETAWIDLPEAEVMPLYLKEFYKAAGADQYHSEMSHEAFADSMGQYFGNRLPIEHIKGLK